MSVLQVAQKGENILNLIAADVSADEVKSSWLSAFVDAMHQVMLERNGVGIAAPQVYLSKRIIIVASRPNPRYPDAPEMSAICMINPKIIKKSEQNILGEEGCLSVPQQRGEVLRADQISVEYLNLDGECIIQEFEGFPARIVQHEIDHLNGILFTAHVLEQ